MAELRTTLPPDAVRRVLAPLAIAEAKHAELYPGPRPDRQPVHTVYGGADLFRADLVQKLGAAALRALDTYAPDADAFAAAIGLPPNLAETVYARLSEKLRREPVEDFRIDFEDGYGSRPDPEEDACAVQAAREVVAAMERRTLPPFIGIRIKPLTIDSAARGVRTLDLFLTALLDTSEGQLPDGFVVTNPKVAHPAQVAALADLLAAIEKRRGLQEGSLRLEIMIETPPSILTAGGLAPLQALVAAGRGRCVAAHFGVYDYTASMDVSADHQTLDHPACDFARHVLQVALAGTGIWISDGATNVMPAPPQRASEGETLTAAQEAENVVAVHRAWRLHFDHVRRSLRHAYYQGWDLHPAQLPTRYAAVYAFFLEGLPAATERLRHFVGRAARATLTGGVFDDAATGQALLNHFLRGLNCGAITLDEAQATGLTLEELRSRSFGRILAGRRAQLPR